MAFRRGRGRRRSFRRGSLGRRKTSSLRRRRRLINRYSVSRGGIRL